MLSIQPDSNLMAPQDAHLNKKVFAREHRVTRGDVTGPSRHLWYQLEVLQQPQRARACGSGPKSSADRRPVDPPPVVTLKVYEGEHYDTAKDITFDYNVDFFCYASLEHARPMAHGRVNTPATTTPPVLTGFPVAGCCYLDRPDPAGYFLFPDLSVRHEGRYRLVFSLYELIKEGADLDRDSPLRVDGDPGDASHRMDLKSTDFTVFSAKKFPGLKESTPLSRTVAEQGCRVRIRRDVRMRRRDTKASAPRDYDNNAEDEYSQRRRTQTPEGYRARSVSNSSMDRTAFPDQRRPSNVEYGAPPPPMYQTSQPAALLNFGGNPSFAQPFGPAQVSHPHSTPVSPAQPMFPVANFQPPPSPSYAPSGYSHYDPPELDTKRRSSGPYPLVSARPPVNYGPRSSIASTTSTGYMPLPPIQSSSPTLSSGHSERLSSVTPPTKSYYSHIEPRPTKRAADDTFPSHQHERILNRNRPGLDSHSSHLESEMIYRRADGTFGCRQPNECE
ncbi:Uu.00g071760.m01.CDS01 [Anthostomella pinea]|uniref:Uu.00g071760.m01.CDS01 n=1 Tax=Anthostomella pinea TaxID=933095 RepID=A0AAI8VUZ9_9PEZI|nr:Uu.00g071760.m01.CDS01 [Anthostomella pinea]